MKKKCVNEKPFVSSYDAVMTATNCCLLLVVSLRRIDSEAGSGVRRAATVLTTKDGQAAESQGSHDHSHHVVRQEE
jgi:hypothetical protein